MSQEQFSDFMMDQMVAIEQSGLDPEIWIEQYAESFRNTWEKNHA